MKAKPIVIKKGHASVRIYATKNRGKPLYCLAYQFAGRRIRKNFRLLEESRKEGNEIVVKLAAGQLQAAAMGNREAEIYAAACEASRRAGKDLLPAVTEYAEAVAILKGQGSVIESARYFVQHHRKLEAKLVPDVVEAFKKSKEKLSERYRGDIKQRLGVFAGTFKGYVANITATEIEEWLDRRGGSPRSRNNNRACVQTLFGFAKRRGWLPRDKATEADLVERVKDEGGEIEIFTPVEMGKLLAVTPPDLLPFMLLCGFAGLRHAEACRIQWEDIRFAEGFIEVTAKNAKTAQRRLVPITENLGAWLARYHRARGAVVPCEKEAWTRVRHIGPEAGVTWKHNGLRHSFASYRLASVQDAAKVALEMGNSPAMIFHSYRQLVTPAQAQAWFAIRPEKIKNMVEFKKEAAC